MPTNVNQTEHNTGEEKGPKFLGGMLPLKEPYKTMARVGGLIGIGGVVVAVCLWRLEVICMLLGIVKEIFRPSTKSIQDTIKGVVHELGKLVGHVGPNEAAGQTSTNEEKEVKAEDNTPTSKGKEVKAEDNTPTSKGKEVKAENNTPTNKGKEVEAERVQSNQEENKWIKVAKQKLGGIIQYSAEIFLVVGFSTVMFTSVMAHALTLGSLTVVPVVLKLLSGADESKYLAEFKEIVNTFVNNVQIGCKTLLTLLTRIVGEDIAAKVEAEYGCTRGGAIGGAVGGTISGAAFTFLTVIHPIFGQAVGGALGATIGWIIGKGFTLNSLKEQGLTTDKWHAGALAGALGGSIGAFYGFMKGGVIGGLAGGMIGMMGDKYLK
ncbi:uncharacterized protein LOC134070254 [Sardina pilchardus]|uniref:uncharacterized protein LOC134070254 n=1 Tax=Sardina pilchardus TaxID=27697 RepID=UPI002E140D98